MSARTLQACALTVALALGCRSPTAASGESGAHDTRLAGVTLHTVEIGARRRPARWMLHGGPGLDHTYLRPWLDAFGSDGAVVYVDLRGHGRSSSPPDAAGYAIHDAADDLAALARARHENTIDVVAHDFGAAVALDLAVRHPGLVHSLVLVAPLRDGTQLAAVGQRSRAVLGDAAWQSIQGLTTPQGTLRDPHDLPRLFRGLGAMWWHQPPSDAVITGMSRSMVYRAEADANFLQASRRWSALAVAAEVRDPALVISGDDDKTFLPAESRALAEALPHGRYAEIAAAGHLPFIEQPVSFQRAVREFWASLSRVP